ncbi:MAG: hypothetical protein IJQ89_06630 [Bacteroidales bacterium]|nr:hypothetical protein [Bacteroidales bacterium]
MSVLRFAIETATGSFFITYPAHKPLLPVFYSPPLCGYRNSHWRFLHCSAQRALIFCKNRLVGAVAGYAMGGAVWH